MEKPKFWEKAKKELIKKDKKLGKIIKNYKSDFLFSRSYPFIHYQDLLLDSKYVKAAQAVWDKLEKKVKKINPKIIDNTHFMTLKSAGLSRQKISYMKALSKAFINETINPKIWREKEDDYIISELVQVKGIGRWTAEMYLIFNLCRPDVFPADDLGLIKGICNCYNLKYPISKEHAMRLSDKWKPWRSVATWYFWRSLDPIPVEY